MHTHAFPEKIAAGALRTLKEGMREQSGTVREPETDGTLGGLRRKMDEAGIDLSVILPIATKPSQTRSINLFAAAVGPQSAGALISFGSVHPADPGAADAAAELPRYGLCGLKLHPEFQQFYIDSPESLAVLRAARDAGLCVTVHAGCDIGLPPPVHCTPERILRVFDRLPDLKLIAAHLGGWMMWDETASLLSSSPVYFDTAFIADFIDRSRARDIILSHDPSRTLLGSDCPWEDPAVSVEFVRSLGLDDGLCRDIFGENAKKLLGLQ